MKTTGLEELESLDFNWKVNNLILFTTVCCTSSTCPGYSYDAQTTPKVLDIGKHDKRNSVLIMKELGTLRPN